MSKSHAPSYGSATLSALKNRIDDFAEILYEDEFLCEDMDKDRQEAQAVIGFLKANNAVESVETFVKNNKTINRWTWDQHQDTLQKYYEERNELPCNHRAHIPPERNENGEYLCKFCGTPHSRETIERAL